MKKFNRPVATIFAFWCMVLCPFRVASMIIWNILVVISVSAQLLGKKLWRDLKIEWKLDKALFNVLCGSTTVSVSDKKEMDT